MIEKTCKLCEERFEVSNYRSDSAKYCSRECKDKSLKEKYKGKNNPSWKGGRNSVEFECDWCGKNSEARQDRLDKYEHNFCSQECRGKWHKDSGLTLGKNNSQWIDGRTWKNRKSSGYGWEEKRDKALEKTGFSCEKCEKHESEISGFLNVHHIKPFEEFETTKEANKLKNLKVLCPKCHTQLHNN